MKTVYLFFDCNHGLLCVAANVGAGIKFLLDECWIGSDTKIMFDIYSGQQFDEPKTIQEILGENWAEIVLDLSADEFEEIFIDHFYIGEEEIIE